MFFLHMSQNAKCKWILNKGGLKLQNGPGKSILGGATIFFTSFNYRGTKIYQNQNVMEISPKWKFMEILPETKFNKI